MDFKEEQRLESKAAFIIFIFAALVTISSIVVSMAGMSEQGENLYSLIWFAMLFIIILGIVYVMMFRLVLETEVNKNGFYFRYYPLIRSNKLIDFNDMISWEMKPRKSWRDRFTFGYKRSRLQKQVYFLLGGNDYLEIKTAGGFIYRFSTQNSYGLTSTMRKYCSEKEIINGERK